MAEANQAASFLKNANFDWIVPAAAVSVVFVMLVPMPSFLLDLLLAMSITASVIVLLSAVYILRPVQFSVFPSLLLLLTLFRLALNLASSRRILLHGNEGTAAAGNVIAAFGQFVVGGNYVVGFVLFIALIAIQFLVVSHGAVRTAEVTARFTLDAMPGKQMAIDADLNAGLIDEHQARARRESVAREAEFYGAMDGAARFSQRDSLATILLTAINIVAGFLIGVFQLDIPFRDALKTYTVLTVGDGLVTMIPSLLVSIAGGLVVTRASSNRSLGGDLGQQLFAQPRVLWIAGAAMFAMGLIPGMPKFSFFLMVAVLWIDGVAPAKTACRRRSSKHPPSPPPEPTSPEPSSPTRSTPCSRSTISRSKSATPWSPWSMPIRAASCCPASAPCANIWPASLASSFPASTSRTTCASSRASTSSRCAASRSPAGRCRKTRILAISSDPEPPRLPGIETREPAFGVPARWIAPELREQAIAAGYSVVDQTSVLATHISELIRQYAHELLTRAETKRLLERLNDSHPKLLDELVPKLMTLGEVQRVLQQLLREQVSIRDLGTILETLVEAAAINKNLVALVEACRQALGRSLIKPLLDEQGALTVVTLDPRIEEELNQAFTPQMPASGSLALQPTFVRRLLEALAQTGRRKRRRGHSRHSLLGQHALSSAPFAGAVSSQNRRHLARRNSRAHSGAFHRKPQRMTMTNHSTEVRHEESANQLRASHPRRGSAQPHPHGTDAAGALHRAPHP